MTVNKLIFALVFGLLWGMLAACTPNPAPAAAPSAAEKPLDGAKLAQAWLVNVGGAIDAPPLAVGDVVVVAPAKTGTVLALDAATGVERWRYSPAEQVWNRALASDGSRVFVGLEGGVLVALNPADGAEVWRKSLGINVQLAPLVDGETLFVPTTFVGTALKPDPYGRAKLFALSAADGSEKWSVETDSFILQTPYRQGDALYTGGGYTAVEDVDEGGHLRIYAIDANSGEIQWTYETQDGFVKALYATDDAVAYIAYRDYVNVLNAADGSLVWRKDTGNWVPSLGGLDNLVFYGAANTVVHGLDVTTGEDAWQFNIGDGTFNYMIGAPVLAEGDLIFLTQKGNVIALNPADGVLKWTFPTPADSPRVGLMVANGRIFIGDGTGQVMAYSSGE